MPANLPPQYFEVEKRYREAKNLQEKLMYLNELLAIIPKHKGTEKLQAELKSKISKLKDMMEKAKKAGGASTSWYQVERQGAGQVVLVGAPNVGKSSLLNSLTNAHVEVADYPFTTNNPQVGMMVYEDIKIQIVDTPPLVASSPAWLYAIYRGGDIILIILDTSDTNLVKEFETIRARLGERNIIFDNPQANNIAAIVVLNKAEKSNSQDNLKLFLAKYGKNYPVIGISTIARINLELLKKMVFERLNIIRVYPKKIGQPPIKKDPLVLKKGTTAIEAAEYIHKDFKKNLRFTKLWNDAGYSGQRVEKNHILKDGDIVEFHV